MCLLVHASYEKDKSEKQKDWDTENKNNENKEITSTRSKPMKGASGF